MKLHFKLVMIVLVIGTSISAQKNDTIKLKEVIVKSNRISLPISETSKTITILTSKEISASSATNVTDLLQNVAGVDVRRRGIEGMQSDLYIRGGNFEQTLLLIDGVKMDDPQTGHHTMNALVSIDNVERIEIIKGPAARVYGQNAMVGAINIVTKRPIKDALNASIGYGSFENKKIAVGFQEKINEDVGVLAQVMKQKSDGYRANSDFDNTSVFVKATTANYGLTATFNNREFGAENFYTTNPAFKEYQETQNSLLALNTTYNTGAIKIMPRLYWRRNQDMFLLKRDNPSFYRNFHISNKVGFETNIVFNSKLGKTGIGVDVSKSYLSSNNLGDRNRLSFNSFMEHRFDNLEKFDVTFGVAISSYSDFKTQFLPGFDIGYDISDNLKLFGNIGYTYRVPTYTDLYYSDPGNQGNPNLEPESAVSEEIGLKYYSDRLNFMIALFNRNSDNLIDWTKENTGDKWQTQNFSAVSTNGFETSFVYNFKLNDFNQNIQLNYNYINDEILDSNIVFSKYSLNSLKHQLNASISTKFLNFLSQSISYRFVERTSGNTYNLVDAKIIASFKKFEFSATANNIFNTDYVEVGLIPMPKGNLMFGVKYQIY